MSVNWLFFVFSYIPHKEHHGEIAIGADHKWSLLCFGGTAHEMVRNSILKHHSSHTEITRTLHNINANFDQICFSWLDWFLV